LAVLAKVGDGITPFQMTKQAKLFRNFGKNMAPYPQLAFSGGKEKGLS